MLSKAGQTVAPNGLKFVVDTHGVSWAKKIRNF